MVTQQLIDYIKQQLQNGISKENIKSALVANGWNENDIIQALNTLDNQPTQTNLTPTAGKQSTSSKKIYYVVFAILLLVAGIAGGFFYLKNKTSLLSDKVGLNNKTLSQWKQIPDMGDQECREIATKSEKIFISCKDHLYKSFDGGKSWQNDSFWDNLNS